MLKSRINTILKDYIFDNSILLFITDLERERLVEHMINIGNVKNTLEILKILLKYSELNFNLKIFKYILVNLYKNIK